MEGKGQASKEGREETEIPMKPSGKERLELNPKNECQASLLKGKVVSIWEGETKTEGWVVHEEPKGVGIPWRNVKGFLRQGWAGEEERGDGLVLWVSLKKEQEIQKCVKECGRAEMGVRFDRCVLHLRGG